AEHVLIDVRHRDDTLLLAQLAERVDAITIVRGDLEIQLARGGAHALLERLPKLVLAPCQEEADRLNLALVLLTLDVEATRRRAALHLVLDAGALAIGQFAVAARPQLKVAFHDVQGAPRRRRRMVGPEVARPVGVRSAYQLEARPGHARIQAQGEKLLVVAQFDGEARAVLLDQAVLEDRRFLLRRGDERLQVEDQARQELDEGARVAAARLEIAADASAQALGLPHVQNAATLIAKEVATRRDRQALQLLFDVLGEAFHGASEFYRAVSTTARALRT